MKDNISMDDTKAKFQYAGLRFLYDMEIIDDPQLINNMKLNIFDVSSCIRDADFLSSFHQKSMLIWLDVNWLGRTFLKKRIETSVTDRVQQLLPNFRFRVTTDRKIFDLALAKVKAALKGEKYEQVPVNVSNGTLTESGAQQGAPSPEQKEPSLGGDSKVKPKSE